MKNIDLLVHARWIIPVVEHNPVLENHCLVIHEGRIIDLLPSEEATAKYHAQIEHQYSNHALIPGLINAHTHAAMTLLRGLADDLPLMDWLNNHIWPAEGRWVSEEFIHDGTQLAIAEMLRSGTTCFNDMYFFPNVTARVAANAGIRACIGMIVIDFPTVWAQSSDEYIEKGLALSDEYRGHALIRTALAPHAPYTVSDAPLKQLQMLSDQMDLPVHMHVHETSHEVEQAVSTQGRRPLQRLQELGLLTPNLVAVHTTQLQDDEIEQLSTLGCHVVHCPESNLKLASGFCPVEKLIQAGVNTALGTDGTASNNDLDMFGEMRTAALLAKGVAGNAAALPAHTALRMATINGAKALGLEQTTGSLEVGKSADFVAVDFDVLEAMPVFDPVSHLVYSCGREQVADVWVAGRHLLKDRMLTTLTEPQIRQNIMAWNGKICGSDSACKLNPH